MPRDLARAKGLACALTLAWLVADAGCARLVTQTTLRAEPLEKPRRVTVAAGERVAVDGQRNGLTLVAQAWNEKRCADELRQQARGWQRSTTRAVGHSLTLSAGVSRPGRRPRGSSGGPGWVKSWWSDWYKPDRRSISLLS